jgi:hypothetical protein
LYVCRRGVLAVHTVLRTGRYTKSGQAGMPGSKLISSLVVSLRNF